MAKGKYYTPEFKEQAAHMCHHVHAADQRDLHLALPQTNDHSTVPGPVIASSLLPIAAKICRRSVSQCS